MDSLTNLFSRAKPALPVAECWMKFLFPNVHCKDRGALPPRAIQAKQNSATSEPGDAHVSCD